MSNSDVPLVERLADRELLRSGAFVGGQWVTGGTGFGNTVFAVRDPATSDVLAELPAMGGAQTSDAVEAARQALPAWRAMSAADRSQIGRAHV